VLHGYTFSSGRGDRKDYIVVCGGGGIGKIISWSAEEGVKEPRSLSKSETDLYARPVGNQRLYRVLDALFASGAGGEAHQGTEGGLDSGRCQIWWQI
jgi:hypothetical protein